MGRLTPLTNLTSTFPERGASTDPERQLFYRQRKPNQAKPPRAAMKDH
jgi:hypothetical protein